MIYGVSAENKVFDNNVQVSLKGQPKADFIQGDQIHQISIGGANFSNAKVGQSKFVALDHLLLQGPDANNYKPFQSTDLKANIVPSESNMSSVPARFDVYTPLSVGQIYSPPSTNGLGQLGKLELFVPKTTSNEALYTIKLDKYFPEIIQDNPIVIKMNAKLKSGEELPSWLRFEPSTMTLSIFTAGVQKQKVEITVGSVAKKLELNIASR